MFDLELYALLKRYTSEAIAEAISHLPKGINYKGAVSYFKDLPNDAEVGDAYTVKYKGESGTKPDGAEYVWAEYEGEEQWISLGGTETLWESGEGANSI